jgi:hypothetical protein
MENLNDRTKAAIYYHVFAGITDRKVLFRIAEGDERANKLTEGSLKTSSTNWFKSHVIQTAISKLRKLKEHEENEIREKCIADLDYQAIQTEAKIQDPENAVNFLDRDEFLKFLNDRANEIKDDKLRNDILKMLSDNLRYKDSENGENTDIQRFYTPILCQDCPLYQKENEK